MKFAVFAALVASSQAKLTGCQKGITGKVFTDAKCATKSKASFSLMEKDVKDAGKCNSHKATDEDKAALVTAKKDLKTASAATKVENDKLDALDKIVVDDLSVTDKAKMRAKEVSAAEAFNAEWPELKAKYLKWRKSQAAYTKYLGTFKVTSERDTVKEYHRLFHAYYELQDALSDTATDAEKQAVADAKTAYEQQEGTLPDGTDTEIVQTEVKDSEDFQKFKMSKIDRKNLTPKCSQDADPEFQQCTPTAQADIEARTRLYLNAEEIYDQVKAKEDGFANVVKSAEDKIDAHTFSTLATCDATAGFTWTTFDDVDCKEDGKKDTEFTAQWGKCTKAPDGKSYVIVTGAAALQAAAVALVAFAGSQF